MLNVFSGSIIMSKIFYISILLIVISACGRPSTVNTSEAHNKRLLLLKTMQDPFFKFIPDSMKHWVPVLSEVYSDDQKFRDLSNPSLYALNKKEQDKIDSSNQVIVMSFLEKYGWPGKFTVGFKGMRAIAMVIQHANLKTQEQYLPILKQAYEKDRTHAETLALLEDRILMKNRKLQLYGTQIINFEGSVTLYPVFNVDSLNARRKALGLTQDISSYLKYSFKSTWSVEEYKKILPKLTDYYNVTSE